MTLEFTRPKRKPAEYDLEQSAARAAVLADVFERERGRPCGERELEGFVRVAFAERKVQPSGEQVRIAKLAAGFLMLDFPFMQFLVAHYVRNPTSDLPDAVLGRCKEVIQAEVNKYLNWQDQIQTG